MATLQAAQSRAVLSTSLLGVCLVAKWCVLASQAAPPSAWDFCAHCWQDVLVAAAFALLATLIRPTAFRVVLYAAATSYLAINVPVARVLATPLTWPLLRAAGGPLADSIITYLTFTNVALVVLILGAAALLPFILARMPVRWDLAAAITWPPLLLMGAAGTTEADSLGLQRNSIVVLGKSLLPRMPALASGQDWRVSPVASDGAVPEDLTAYQGLAAGRNVVFIHLESTAAQYLRPFGAADDPMPNLTKLAQRGIVFDHAYCAYPESIKGLYSVLCSTYPAMDTEPEVYAGVGPPSIAELCSQAGYRTALFHSGRFAYLGMESIIHNRGYHLLEDAGAIGGDYESSFGVAETATVERMTAWIDGLPPGQRFMLTYLPIAGHHPYNVPEAGPFPDDTPFGQYCNALHYADAALGKLFAAFRERGLDRNTLFVILGDHGEAFGQHAGNMGHVFFVYEENVHVPLMIVAPGLTDQPRRVKRVASLVDVVPTVVDLLGWESPAGYQGHSLLKSELRLALAFTDYSLGILGLRDGNWKCTHDVDLGRTRLYQLRDDPREERDLASQFPERTAAYRAHLLGWAQAQRAHVQSLQRSGR